MVIGITGGSGTGKSLLARLLGYRTVDADAVYRSLLDSCAELRSELTAAFGSCERGPISAAVFSCPKKLELLNKITFKYTVPAIKKLISADAINVIDAPLLFESGADADCDVTVAVLAEREKRIERITARDGISRERAEARVDAQKKDEYYIKSADHIVNSNGEGLERAAASLKAKIFGINKNFAVYGGTFDPPTLGHLDVIRRAASVFGSVFAVVFENGGKHPAFLTERRVEMLKAITADITNVTVEQYGGLIAEYARGKKINFLVRGVRNASDADYERTMAEYNRQIAEEDFGFALETVLFPAARRHADTSSNNVRILLSSGAFKTAEKYLDERIHGMVFNNYK